MEQSQVNVDMADPLEIQMEHFCRVVAGEEAPIVNARDGAESLAVALAVQESASRGMPVDPSTLLSGANR